MKKVITEKILCPASIIAGLLGLLLRLWLFATGVDERGLLVGSHPGNIMVFVLVALMLSALLWCVFKCPKQLRKPLPASRTAYIGCMAAAAGILLADILELTNAQDLVTVVSSAIGILAAISFFYMGIRRRDGHRSSMVAFTLIIVYFMSHLILQYRLWSAQPQLQLYVFPLLASVFLMLFAYHRAGLDVNGKGFRQYIFFNQATLFFCCLSLNTDTWLFYLAMAVWAATDLHICAYSKQVETKGKMQLPEQVHYCIDALKKAGYSAYVVGGCVRDALLGRQPHDYDLCTSATPEQICQVFSAHQLVRSGEKHGTIGVVLEKQVYEITTFRTEGKYTDSRHPDWVEFVTKIQEDLSRRDFTVNAMAYTPDQGYVDPWEGRKDLQEGVLRTVGDPVARFTEDPLRILRGVRFAVRYGLEPEPETEKAMFDLAHLMDNLARERVFDEMCKLLPTVKAKDLVRFAPVIVRVIPELEPAISFDQSSKYHIYDVYTHTAHVVENTPRDLTLRWAALLHDVAKPQTFTMDEKKQGHFYGHAEQGAQIADQIMQRLKAPNALRQQVAFLVEAHMLNLEVDKRVLRRRISKVGLENVEALMQLQKADMLGTGVADTRDFDRLQALLEQIKQEASCLSIKDLAVNGLDLKEMGIEPGPKMGQILNKLLEKVLNEELPNDKQALIDAIKEM